MVTAAHTRFRCHQWRAGSGSREGSRGGGGGGTATLGWVEPVGRQGLPMMSDTGEGPLLQLKRKGWVF
jgi:hypothetical protein